MKIDSAREVKEECFNIHRGDNYRGKSQLSTNHVVARQRNLETKMKEDLAITTKIFDCREIPDLTIQSYLEIIFTYTRPPL
jgi:hypothetical protein